MGGERGLDETTGNVSDVYRYDPATNVWTKLASLPAARSHFSSSLFVRNNRLIAIGGTRNGGTNGVPTADVTEYDPSTNKWRYLTSLPMALKTPVAALLNGKIISTTGNASSGAGPVAKLHGVVEQESPDDRRIPRRDDGDQIQVAVQKPLTGVDWTEFEHLGPVEVEAHGRCQFVCDLVGPAAGRAERDPHARPRPAPRQILRRHTREDPERLVEQRAQRHQFRRLGRARGTALDERHADAVLRVTQPLDVFDRPVGGPQLQPEVLPA
jgi:hypothetical protein